MGFFYRHNPKKFNYKPRYFDPDMQEWEEKKAAAGLDSKLSHEEQLRIRMRKSWSVQKDVYILFLFCAKLIRRTVLGVFVAFLFYFIFCTPLMTNVVCGLMGK